MKAAAFLNYVIETSKGTKHVDGEMETPSYADWKTPNNHVSGKGTGTTVSNPKSGLGDRKETKPKISADKFPKLGADYRGDPRSSGNLAGMSGSGPNKGKVREEEELATLKPKIVHDKFKKLGKDYRGDPREPDALVQKSGNIPRVKEAKIKENASSSATSTGNIATTAARAGKTRKRSSLFVENGLNTRLPGEMDKPSVAKSDENGRAARIGSNFDMREPKADDKKPPLNIDYMQKREVAVKSMEEGVRQLQRFLGRKLRISEINNYLPDTRPRVGSTVPGEEPLSDPQLDSAIGATSTPMAPRGGAAGLGPVSNTDIAQTSGMSLGNEYLRRKQAGRGQVGRMPYGSAGPVRVGPNLASEGRKAVRMDHQRLREENLRSDWGSPDEAHADLTGQGFEHQGDREGKHIYHHPKRDVYASVEPWKGGGMKATYHGMAGNRKKSSASAAQAGHEVS